MSDSPSVVAAIDQGTTSSRCLLFDHRARVIARDQVEHSQGLPQAGWVEHDAMEIWANVRTVMAGALARAKLADGDVAAIGIANQRETTVVWDRTTGRPVAPAIVWQDLRTRPICDALSRDGGKDRFRHRTGLPVATYFAGPKARWILDNVHGARARADAGSLAFGTMDSWLLWNLTGGSDGGIHLTDATNASRTMMMNLDTLRWEPEIADAMKVPLQMLPEIRSSSEHFGTVQVRGPMAGVPITGILGDQQAAMFGQACFEPGEIKTTYGTGNFVLLNTGTDKVLSKNGLLTTVCYSMPGADPVYALEGSVAVTGSLVQWLRDNLGLIGKAAEVEALANSVPDSAGVYIVPAFSGLFAPHWRPDARGVIVGLTRFANRGHFARAALEATAYQTREVIEAMRSDFDVVLSALRVDGGMVANDLLMQFQADMLDVPVVRPTVAETTALGAAYAAGLAVGFWTSMDDLRANWAADKHWRPTMPQTHRDELYAGWKKALVRTLGWVDSESQPG